MSRTPKDSIKVSYTLDRKVAESLEKFCVDTGRTKTKVVELAITEFIEKYGREDAAYGN